MNVACPDPFDGDTLPAGDAGDQVLHDVCTQLSRDRASRSGPGGRDGRLYAMLTPAATLSVCDGEPAVDQLRHDGPAARVSAALPAHAEHEITLGYAVQYLADLAAPPLQALACFDAPPGTAALILLPATDTAPVRAATRSGRTMHVRHNRARRASPGPAAQEQPGAVELVDALLLRCAGHRRVPDLAAAAVLTHLSAQLAPAAAAALTGSPGTPCPEPTCAHDTTPRQRARACVLLSAATALSMFVDPVDRPAEVPSDRQLSIMINLLGGDHRTFRCPAARLRWVDEQLADRVVARARWLAQNLTWSWTAVQPQPMQLLGLSVDYARWAEAGLLAEHVRSRAPALRSDLTAAAARLSVDGAAVTDTLSALSRELGWPPLP